MITYRNPIWNVTIKFLRELRNLPYLKDNFDGKYSKRVDGIYQRALAGCHVSSTDWNLIINTLQFVTEKDVTDEMREAFEVAKTQGTKCFTSSDGKTIFKEAMEMVAHNKIVCEAKTQLEKAKQEAENAKVEYEKWDIERNSIVDKYDETQRKLKKAMGMLNKVVNGEAMEKSKDSAVKEEKDE